MRLSGSRMTVRVRRQEALPAPGLNAAFVSSLELVGGILLVVGLASRLIAVPLVINMLVAYLTADRGDVHGTLLSIAADSSIGLLAMGAFVTRDCRSEFLAG